MEDGCDQLSEMLNLAVSRQGWIDQDTYELVLVPNLPYEVYSELRCRTGHMLEVGYTVCARYVSDFARLADSVDSPVTCLAALFDRSHGCNYYCLADSRAQYRCALRVALLGSAPLDVHARCTYRFFHMHSCSGFLEGSLDHQNRTRFWMGDMAGYL